TVPDMSESVSAKRTNPLNSAVPPRLWLLLLIALIVTAVTEWIGPIAVPLWSAKVVILPMLMALIITTGLAAWYAKFPNGLQLGPRQQQYAGKLLNAALLLFIVKLGLMAGHSMPQLREIGWALA